MNNNYYTLVNNIKKVAKQNEIVQTVLYARTEDKDLFKNTLFPLVHVNPTSTTFINEKVSNVTFEIGSFSIRDYSKIRKDKGFEGQDNVIDNHNTTYAILNEMLTTLAHDAGNQIYMQDNVSLQPIFFSDKNGLDGWIATVTFQIPSFLNISENL